MQVTSTRTSTRNASVPNIQQVVTKATGTLQLTMQLVANIVFQRETKSSTMTIQLQLVTEATAAASPPLTLDASSPVQLVSPA
jgi:hypothetical protein